MSPGTIDRWLVMAYEQNASDVHISSGNPVIFRIDGMLKRVSDHILSAEETRQMLVEALPQGLHDRLESNHEIDFSLVASNGMRFRANYYRKHGDLCGAFRLIPSKVPTMRELRLPPVLENFTRLPWGLVLVTGPTGSGKTTTLAAMINEINTREARHIVTLEDPIEYVHTSKQSLVTQREIGTDTPNFSQALRALLREDPDVVLLGEMRDLETIATALTVAETGHLVFATLHTNSAAQTIDRIIDVFPPDQQAQVRTQLSMTLKAVISQRLMLKRGGGRIAVHEILVVTPGVANMIRSGNTSGINNAIKTGGFYGMVTMEQSIQKAIADDLLDEEVAKSYLAAMRQG